MWRRGGRSCALDRAQALLFAKRNSTGDAGPVQGSAAKTRLHAGAVGAPPNTHSVFSDPSDLSSVSSAPEHGADTLGCAAAAGKTQDREGGPTKDLKPQGSLGGEGSRFLKKAPPPATNSSQEPVSKRQTQQVLESRYVSSQRGSQAAALSRLAQIESRIRSRKQAPEQARQPAEDLTSVLGASLPPAAQSPESSSDQSLKGKHFFQNKTVNSSAAARSPEGVDAGVRSRPRAADAGVPSAGLKSVRLGSGVSLESDEEDMKKLLGDSLDSTDNSFLIPRRASSIRTVDKMLIQSSEKVRSTPTPSAPPRSPASPHRGSPFRFTGQSRAHFSPSALSPSPSPPPRRQNSPHKVGSPQRSLSSMSGCSEVLSLDELFPVGPGSEDPHSEMSAISSEDFKINVMTLDDLVPAAFGFSEETPGKEREAKHSSLVPNRPHQLPRSKEKEEEEEQRGEGLRDYQSDFESQSRMEPDYSASQVSEHVQGDGDEEEAASEVIEETSDSEVSRGRTEDDYSSTFSDTSRSRTSDRRSRCSVSHGSRTSFLQSGRLSSSRKLLKEAAVQTQPDPLAYTRPAGLDTLGPAVGMTHMGPTPVVAHTLSAEMVEALSTFNPAVFALNEMFKQQLAMTRQFIESSRHLHSSLVQSLEPPNYRYTTLEDTKEYIRKHRPPKLTMENALEEVLQEMRDYQHM